MSQQTQLTKQQENAERLFKKPYMVTIPYIQMVTAEDLEMFGMPRSGDSYYDQQVANEIRTIMIPIVKIAEYYNEGADVRLAKRDDAKEIYETIRDHLAFWKQHIDGSINQVNAPIEDLMLLDRFAGRVYEHARYQYQFDNQYVSSLLGRMGGDRATSIAAMLGGIRANRATVQRQGTKFDQAANVVPDTPQYRSYAKDFAPAARAQLNSGLNVQGQPMPQSDQPRLGSLGRAIGDMLARNTGQS